MAAPIHIEAAQAEAESLMAETARNGTAKINGRAAAAQALAARGLAVIDGDMIRLTAAGRYASKPKREQAAGEAIGLGLPETEQPQSVPFSEVAGAVDELEAKDRARRKAPPMKETNEDRAVSNQQYSIVADELRQFIEQFEQMDAEKSDVADRQKALMAEAKARGYDTKSMRRIIARRKRKADDIAEAEAIDEVYMTALGMI